MKLRDLALAACCGLLVAAGAGAQETKPAGHPAMSAEQHAAMEAWAKFANPGEGHRSLAGMAGAWDAEVTSWMEPGAPTKSKGTSENRLILGGRWVEQRFKSEMMGQPFEGLGYTGYDNLKKKYIGTWMDTMSTAVMVTEGTWDAAGKVMTSTSTMDDPMTGKSSPVKMTTTIVTPDHHKFEMWGPDPAGKMVKQMQIDYHRRK